MIFKRLTIIFFFLFSISASASEDLALRIVACSEASSDFSDYKSCTSIMVDNPNLTAEKIIQCGKSSSYSLSFDACLIRATFKSVSAQTIKTCGEKHTILKNFSDCIK
ncbi:MAG: hypothetical protein H6625_08070 [Bdellovibrionaceae bacterium]|nr:hypothetical protein [Pseudobdellovibrionaceae bacterium]